MNRIKTFFRQFFFEKAYLSDPPWDSGVTPPELEEFVKRHAPGAALDLGCGTGTNLLYLARHGWQVDGIDFAWLAVYQARRRLKKAGVHANVVRGDVTRLQDYTLRAPFDLALDIGCLHALGGLDAAHAYAEALKQMLREGGTYLLYAHDAAGDDQGTYPPHGLSLAWAQALFSPAFTLLDYQPGSERGRGSTWYVYQKGACSLAR